MTNRVRSQPILAVNDVPKSSAFYAELLGLEATSQKMKSDHAWLYDRLMDGDRLVLQLHCWDEEAHPNLVREPNHRAGYGVLVWFELDDFDAAVARARRMKVEIVEDVHRSPAPQHREMWLRDPDGYVVVLCSPDGESPS